VLGNVMLTKRSGWVSEEMRDEREREREVCFCGFTLYPFLLVVELELGTWRG
jgi:hypothetical protein